MKPDFGAGRVEEPLNGIPVAAWKLDNGPELREGELRVRVKRLKLEDASFKQICSECGYDRDKVKEKIIDIVKKRGKLHNPATGSGGILCGVVDEVGPGYGKKNLFKAGDRVISLTSLAATPLHISHVDAIDFSYGMATVEGHAILSSQNPVIHEPYDLPSNYTLFALEGASSLHSVYRLAAEGEAERFLIFSSDLLSAALYSAALRKAVTAGRGENAAKSCRVVAALDKRSLERIADKDIRCVLGDFVDEVFIIDILSPIKSYEEILAKEKALFDFSVNCADLMGAEAVGVLLTERNGSVNFTSFINNLNLALLFAEALGKEVSIRALGEYTYGYKDFTLGLLREIKDKLDAVDRIYAKRPDAKSHGAKSGRDSQLMDAGRIGDFVYASPNMRSALDEALNVAGYDCNVVIFGETGVGKEKILSLIHNNSDRKLNPCVRINCAAIPETLAESEFFGYEAGAFTGSSANGKAGYFELANNGILFLDEVGLLPAAIQVKLLRVLQENQFFRIGGMKQMDVNVRVVCASNVSLKELVREGKFREDLYYRLNICEIKVPPLRERLEDISSLADFFLRRYNDMYGINKRFEPGATEAMLAYEWPGNVRELENTVHRMVVSSRGDGIGDSDVYHALGQSPRSSERHEDAPAPALGDHGLEHMMMNYERKFIEDALKKWKNTRKAAAHLGISQSQLMRKKQKYHIE
ncbi:MAG: sigma 54-interacting transcriptional regulator [Clostridiales Family XIII bacterium]|jgi:DNA-binding NtrC family response regulator|nr:sigma 54-interacting transcriptional regulator [Clostridiales Family XIII bacterium]